MADVEAVGEECVGCMACVSVCPNGSVAVDVGVEFCTPSVDREACVSCGLCARVCQHMHPLEKTTPALWFQGWANDELIRSSASSGGLATAVAKGFIMNGGWVCSCAFEKGSFVFAATNSMDRIRRFQGSKYVKSNPAEVFSIAKNLLSRGERVLFIGLPCQVAAMKSLATDADARLFTVDLICHGTPSALVFDQFMSERGYSLHDIEGISFRRGSVFGVEVEGDEAGFSSVLDRFMVAYLAGLIYTENCYKCIYAGFERVSDVTLGDSWGTNLKGEAKSGVSLALCQSEKGRELLGAADLHLEEVDIDTAIAHNGQLRNPSIRPSSRNRFVSNYRKGMSFDRNVFRCLPKQCLKQTAKRIIKFRR